MPPNVTVVVRAHTHRPRYRPGDTVKCYLSLHSAGKSSVGEPRSAIASASTAVVSAIDMVPFDVSRLFPDPLHPAAADATAPCPTLHEVSLQLVGCCFADTTRLALPTSFRDDDVLAAALHEATRAQLAAPDVRGRNEDCILLCVSKPSVPIRGMPLRVGDPKVAAVLFSLPEALVLPTYRGTSVRVSYTVFVAVRWSLGTDSSSTRVTTVRLPVRVHMAEVLMYNIVTQLPPPADDEAASCANGSAAPAAGCAFSGGEFVLLPSEPSPAFLPPLEDGLFSRMPDESSASSSNHTRGGVAPVAGGATTRRRTAGRIQSSEAEWTAARSLDTSSLDVLSDMGYYFVQQRLCHPIPTEYWIRYGDVHIMNLLVESCTVPVGGYLRGAFVHKEDECATTQPLRCDARVGRINMTIECYEITEARYVASGAHASEALLPRYLRQPSATTRDGSADTTAEGDRTQVVLHVTTVEEKEWFVVDALQQPFEICLHPTKYHQSIRTSMLSIEWVIRWKFSCVEAAHLHSSSSSSTKKRLKDLYQELELPLTILPTVDMGGDSRMGPPVFAS